MAENGQAAGGTPPAARVSGPQWRERHDPPVYSVALWPNQSLTRGGYRAVLVIAGAGLALPLLPVAGTPVFWGLAPFLVLAFLALRHAILRNTRQMRLEERLSVWSDEVRVERREPDGRVLRWQSDPLSLRLRLHREG